MTATPRAGMPTGAFYPGPQAGQGHPPQGERRPGAEVADQRLIAPPAGWNRRRNLPRALLGVGLVVGCALLFAVIASATGRDMHVLALARDVQPGQLLQAADFTVVDVASSGADAMLVPDSQEKEWIGRTLTGPLPVGQLLSPSNLGPAAWPPSGSGVVAVPVKAGRLPSGVVAGSAVRVVVPPSTDSTASAGAAMAANGSGTSRPLEGTVVQVMAGDMTAGSSGTSGEGSVLSLLMSTADAASVAAAGDDVVVILTGPAAGSAAPSTEASSPAGSGS